MNEIKDGDILIELNLDPYSFGDGNEPEEINRLVEIEFQRVFDMVLVCIKKGFIAHVIIQGCGWDEFLIVKSYAKDGGYLIPDDMDLHYNIDVNDRLDEQKDRVFEKVFKYRSGVYVSQYNTGKENHTDFLNRDDTNKEMKELKLHNALTHYLSGDGKCDFDNRLWIENDTLFFENYMDIMEIGYLVKDYKQRNNGKQLKIVFQEQDSKELK
ncbi:TPA: hypothetical protein ACS8CE_003494 [Providencia alcalifaciens]